MLHTTPTTRRLILAWMTLMGLTLLSLLGSQFGYDGQHALLPWFSAALILIASFYKAHQVLMIYLNLRASSSAWQGLFITFLLMTFVLVAAGTITANILGSGN
jgi:hypothetical protein